MKTLLTAVVVAATLCLGGCAMQDERAFASAVGQHDEPTVSSKDGPRREFLLGSRIPRDSRENSEYTKTMSPRAYENARHEQTGIPDARLPM